MFQVNVSLCTRWKEKMEKEQRRMEKGKKKEYHCITSWTDYRIPYFSENSFKLR